MDLSIKYSRLRLEYLSQNHGLSYMYIFSSYKIGIQNKIIHVDLCNY